MGFEPMCLAANGFQDSLDMTTSIPLRGSIVIIPQLKNKVNKKFPFLYFFLIPCFLEKIRVY